VPALCRFDLWEEIQKGIQEEEERERIRHDRMEHLQRIRFDEWKADWDFFDVFRFPATLSVTNSRVTSSRSPVVTTSKVRLFMRSSKKKGVLGNGWLTVIRL